MSFNGFLEYKDSIILRPFSEKGLDIMFNKIDSFKPFFISISQPLEIKQLERIRELLTNKSNVGITVEDFGDFKNLYFLEYFTQIQHLSLAFLRKKYDLNALNEMRNLRYLNIVAYHTSSISLLFLKNLNNLINLSIKCKFQDEYSISGLNNLLSFYTDNTNLDLDVLSDLKKLEILHLWGKLKNYSNISKLVSLEVLKLGDIKDLTNIDFVSNLTNLGFLSLYRLNNLTHLPDFSSDASLKFLSIEKADNLLKYSSLQYLNNLQRIFITQIPKSCKVEDFYFLKEMKNLQYAQVILHYSKEDKKMKEFLEHINLWKKPKLFEPAEIFYYDDSNSKYMF